MDITNIDESELDILFNSSIKNEGVAYPINMDSKQNSSSFHTFSIGESEKILSETDSCRRYRTFTSGFDTVGYERRVTDDYFFNIIIGDRNNLLYLSNDGQITINQGFDLLNSYMINETSELYSPYEMFISNDKIYKTYTIIPYIETTKVDMKDQDITVKLFNGKIEYMTKINARWFINKRFSSVMDKFPVSCDIYEDFLPYTYIENEEIFSITCEFFFHGGNNYSKINLEILFKLLNKFTNNNKYEETIHFIEYMNHHLNIRDKNSSILPPPGFENNLKIDNISLSSNMNTELSTIYRAIPYLTIPSDYLMAYIFERRNNIIHYMDFIRINYIHYNFIYALQILYISEFGLYEENITVEKIIKKQDLIINNYVKNTKLYKTIVDKFDLIVFLPIHTSLEDKHINFNKSLISEKERLALKKYTKYYDEIINNSLRNRINFNGINKDIEEIFKVLNSTVRKKYHLYRGVTNGENLNKASNNRIVDKAFMSKTYLPTIARKFTTNGCCILCFIYKYGSPLLDISSVSYFPEEAEVLTFPGEIYSIIGKKKCCISSVIIDIYFVEVIGNYYENNFLNLLNVTTYKPIYDVYNKIIINCLKRHIDYNDKSLSHFNGIVYLKTAYEVYIFSQFGTNDNNELNYYNDLGCILRAIMLYDYYEFGELNIDFLPFGLYNYRATVYNKNINGYVNLNIDEFYTGFSELLLYNDIVLIDINTNSEHICFNNIILSK